MVYDFSNTPMQEIVDKLKEIIAYKGKDIRFEVINPDFGIGNYAGDIIKLEGKQYIYHGLKSWINLAEILHHRMMTPKSISKYTIEINFIALDKDKSFHTAKANTSTEKYGIDSIFSKIQKLEEPSFLLPYIKALESVHIKDRVKILDLGVNSGDEFLAIKNMLDLDTFNNMELIGIDYSLSAINQAKETFDSDNAIFYCHDINRLDELSIDRQDLIISIGTLQSPNIDSKPLVMSLVQNYLSKNGALIIAFPNARWIDAELVYGAKAPNYPYSELSLVIKDIYWIKKYLQQHKFRVTITGREYLFLTATRIGL